MKAQVYAYGAASALVMVAVANAAQAQSQPTPSTPTAVSSPAADSVSQDIVVTANRTESLASKTAISLTAASGKQLLTQQITDPTRLAEVVPNLSIDRANGLQITIRGVSSSDGTDKGDPSAAFLLDGIYIARPQAQEVSFFDIDRVEVLRGPQGTLYGRNTTAGVVNIIAKKPSFDFGGNVDVNIGDYGTRQVTAVINVPLSDTLAVRLGGNYDTRNTYVTQVAPQSFSLPKDKDNLSTRGSILYKPTDRVSLLVQADYAAMHGSPSSVLASNFFQTPFAAPPAGAKGIDPQYIDLGTTRQLEKDSKDVVRGDMHGSTWGVMAQADVKLSDAFQLTYLGGYRKLDLRSIGNFLFGSIFSPTGARTDITVPVTNRSSFDQQSHEVRLAYSSGRLKAQAGLYYFRENYQLAGVLYGLISPTPGTPGYIYGFLQNPGGNRSFATFGQATYSVTDSIRLTGGVRWTEDRKFRTGATIIHANESDPYNSATDSLNKARLTTRKVIWKAGVEADAGRSTLLYGTVSTGYKAGGFIDGCQASDAGCKSPLPAAALYYKPETLTSFEAGVKTKALDGKLRLSADYFHYNYNDLQVTQVSSICGVPCQLTTNAAKAKVDGVEVEGTFALTRRNQFDFSGTWLDARYADWEVVPGVNLKGFKLDRSPKFTMTAGYTYTQPVGNGSVVANIRTRYSDSYGFLSTTLRAQFVQPSFTRTTASLTYNAPGGAWYLQGYVRNIENNLALTGASTASGFPGLNGGSVGISDPRTYGMRAGVKF